MNTLLLPLLGAPEAGGAAGGAGGMMSFLPFILIIGIFYFLIIRPQNKKQKETQKMLTALKKGDKVVTIGGIHGTIASVKEQTVVVKVDDDAKMEFSRSAISSVVNQTEEKIAEKPEKPAKKGGKKAELEAPATAAATPEETAASPDTEKSDNDSDK
jgi:preprotein translocase subunit YajC